MCERLLKGGSHDVTMSIRNVQLGVPSFLLGMAAMYLQNSKTLMEREIFQGYTHWTWAVDILHSFGVCTLKYQRLSAGAQLFSH